MTYNGSELISMDQSGSEWIKTDQNGSKQIKMDHKGSNWIIGDQIGIKAYGAALVIEIIFQSCLKQEPTN